MTDYLRERYPTLAKKLGKVELADLPTPVTTRRLRIEATPVTLSIKCDDRTSSVYGGNKVRKLEYLFFRARARNKTRVATFGSVTSHHVLATAMYAQRLGLGCTCLLMHQDVTPKSAPSLNRLLEFGAEVVSWNGRRRERVAALRSCVGRDTWVIPLGGSSWLGSVGYVGAGLELAAQVDSGDVALPDRVYAAAGTLGTVAGLALGFALAGLPTVVQAIRVTDPRISDRSALDRLLHKTALLMRRYDATIPADLEDQVNIELRDEFLGPGYAKTTPEAEHAIAVAERELGLTLESTYTGKAMAALMHDIRRPELRGHSFLFWNTFNSQPLPRVTRAAPEAGLLPDDFLRYYD